jgi:putative sterol carrier protein
MPAFESKEELYQVLDKTVAALTGNEGFARRIASARASLGIVVPEVQGDYALHFEQGQVTGVVGGAASASVAATMTGDVLDRLFSGKMDAESAYMNGHVQLRGSEWVAESMVGYLWDLRGAYVAARGS